MPALSLEIKGYNRVANNLRRLASDLEKELDAPIDAFAKYARQKLRSTPYPPKRPMQKYVRTGRLANSWRVRKLKDSQYSIDNNAAGPRGQLYATYVVGGPQGNDVSAFSQAWMHRGRWWLSRDVLQDEAPRLTAVLTAEIKAIWES